MSEPACHRHLEVHAHSYILFTQDYNWRQTSAKYLMNRCLSTLYQLLNEYSLEKVNKAQFLKLSFGYTYLPIWTIATHAVERTTQSCLPQLLTTYFTATSLQIAICLYIKMFSVLTRAPSICLRTNVKLMETI